MARSVEEFNPWPAFVDLFASIIMVVLMFLLVLIVNVAFYSQYKYKIAYTGSVSVENLKLEESEEKKEFKDEQKLVESEQKKKDKYLLDVPEEIIASGLDLTVSNHEYIRQENIIHLDWMIIKFMKNELTINPEAIKELEAFIVKAKKEFVDHKIEIFISEPKKQVSATVAKQIGLSRALNVRNIIRKQNYKNEDVFVRLRKDASPAQKIEHDPGYIVISIMNKGK